MTLQRGSHLEYFKKITLSTSYKFKLKGVLNYCFLPPYASLGLYLVIIVEVRNCRFLSFPCSGRWEWRRGNTMLLAAQVFIFSPTKTHLKPVCSIAQNDYSCFSHFAQLRFEIMFFTVRVLSTGFKCRSCPHFHDPPG